MKQTSLPSLQKTLEKVRKNNFQIEVFGLGYVGLPACINLANSGFNVTGIDINKERVNQLTQNNLRKSEANLKKEFLESCKKGNLVFSTKPKKSNMPKIGIICVPTPVHNITSDVFVETAIKNFVGACNKRDVIIIESSIEIGTFDNMKTVIEKSRNFKIGDDFGLCFCPERIDPKNTTWTIKNTPRVIYCSDDVTFRIAENVFRHVNNSNLIRVSSANVAELVKSYENAFRLVNISLVNELAVLCDKLRINVREVIDSAATKPFGFMPFYPGPGAGGHCIPKDPQFLLNYSRTNQFNFQTIENAFRVNSFMPKYISDSIEQTLLEIKLKKSVIVCGLSYKPDIEDMRNSPGFKILKEFHKRNFDVVGYDPFFNDKLRDKYLAENNLLPGFEFRTLENLDDKLIQNYSCLCITQHHTKVKSRLEEIYQNSSVPLIYDCQNQMRRHSDSKTHLKGLGRSERLVI